jgi:hypothetical protein
MDKRGERKQISLFYLFNFDGCSSLVLSEMYGGFDCINIFGEFSSSSDYHIQLEATSISYIKFTSGSSILVLTHDKKQWEGRVKQYICSNSYVDCIHMVCLAFKWFGSSK